MFLSLGTPHDPWTAENVPPQYLEKFKDKEFKLPHNYLPKNDPHADAWARLSEQERSELPEWMRVYYAMTANLDDNIGRLMDEIKALGLDKNSIIIFIADHGELFGAHGRRAKNIFYEEAIRVPFLLKWADHLESNVKRDFVFNTVDIMPTLLSMMELPIPREVEGNDYSACIEGIEDTEEGALMMGTGPTAVFGDENEWRAYRTKHYTYAVYKVDGQELMFDNIADPFQMNNLIQSTDHTKVVEALKEQMWEKMNQIGDNFEKNIYYQKNWVENRNIKHAATL